MYDTLFACPLSMVLRVLSRKEARIKRAVYLCTLFIEAFGIASLASGFLAAAKLAICFAIMKGERDNPETQALHVCRQGLPCVELEVPAVKHGTQHEGKLLQSDTHDSEHRNCM